MQRSVVAGLIGLSILALSSCGQAASTPQAPGTTPAAGTWTRLPDSPLSPREGPATAHVATPGGDLAVFVGGYTGPPCPPTADCNVPAGSTAADGTAYNVDTGAWQDIADAPRPVVPSSPTAVLGDTMYVLTDNHLLAWDAGDDAWTELTPPHRPQWSYLVADTRGGDPCLVVASGSDEYGVRPDQVYDPATGAWSVLPPNPLRPSFDRAILSTPAGLVLTAQPISPDGGPADPGLVRAAVLAPGASQWRSLPTAEDQLGGWNWTWTGTRLVDPTPGGSDGGEVDNYGRTIPYGGALDPATGAWTNLEGTPDEFTGGWAVDALGGLGGRLSAVQGWIYDDGDHAGDGRGWTRLVRPDGAPEEPGRGVWVGDLLVVAGGTDLAGFDNDEIPLPGEVWSTGAWAFQVG